MHQDPLILFKVQNVHEHQSNTSEVLAILSNNNYVAI